MNLRDVLLQTRKASRTLLRLEENRRTQVLQDMALALERETSRMLEANKKDLQSVSGQSSAFVKRMTLTEEKMQSIITYPRKIAAMPPVVGDLMMCRELDEQLMLCKIRYPLGVVGFVFESRPDAYIQMLSLAWKTANALVWKGGSETMRTTTVLHEIIQSVTRDFNIMDEWNLPLHQRAEVTELLSMEGLVDLIIPRGSKEMVAQIMRESRVPVLGHADGICHVYVDATADDTLTTRIIWDAKVQNPGVCNAMETLLVHTKKRDQLPALLRPLLEAGVQLRGDTQVCELFPAAEMTDDWQKEYLDLILAVRIVSSLDEAIDHINRHGSAHTDAIISSEEVAKKRFVQQVDSANVMVNCSTRFSDGYRYGLGAETGISTGKLHARGPVGLDGLLTYKWVLEGNGQIVGDYMGEQARSFTHRNVIS